jgi:hypothetical protein
MQTDFTDVIEMAMPMLAIKQGFPGEQHRKAIIGEWNFALADIEANTVEAIEAFRRLVARSDFFPRAGQVRQEILSIRELVQAKVWANYVSKLIDVVDMQSGNQYLIRQDQFDEAKHVTPEEYRRRHREAQGIRPKQSPRGLHSEKENP